MYIFANRFQTVCIVEMEATASSETLVNSYWAARHQVPADSKVYSHHCMKLKSLETVLILLSK